MNYYLVHVYYDFGLSIYNPINNTYQPNLNGTIYLPLNLRQYIKLTQNITNNNIGQFSKLFIINNEIINIFFYENIIKLVNKENFIINNNNNVYYLPQYYIILNIETLL
jgi:hypothetical protein